MPNATMPIMFHRKTKLTNTHESTCVRSVAATESLFM